MKYMKLIWAFVCLFAVVMRMPANVNAAALDTNSLAAQTSEAVISGCHSVDAKMTLLGTDPVIEKVAAAIAYEVKSDTLMYAMNADERMYPSSLVKIMTALIAAEQGNPDDLVTVRAEVLSTVPSGAVSAKLQPDETISLRDLLYCMMVGSANDAAAVIADHICGSQEAFVSVMNEYAQALGCTQTNFVNAHGLHDEQQYTTARDMIRILAAAVKNSDFVSYYGATNHTVAATNKSEARELSSGNYLMNLMNSDNMQIYYDPRVTGGRTGVTEDGKRCLATSAESNDMQIITVLMGAEDVLADDGHTVRVFGGYKETTLLLDASFNGFKTVQILFPNQAIQQKSVTNGESDVVLGVQASSYVVLPEGVSTAELNYRYNDKANVAAPIQKGDPISSVQIWHGSRCVAEADLFALNSVSFAVPLAEDHDNSVSDNRWLTVLIVVFAICVFTAVVVVGIRYLSVLRHRIRQKHYRKARRRSR